MEDTRRGVKTTHTNRNRDWLLRHLSFYPPHIGAGIRVKYDPSGFHVRMNPSWYNRNAVGTHFGGSLYAMWDPYFMLMLRQQLGPGYIVWDKGATIDFVRPARGTVHADFQIASKILQDIKTRADKGEKIEPLFEVDVKDGDGQVVAHVQKRLYVRRRKPGE